MNQLRLNFIEIIILNNKIGHLLQERWILKVNKFYILI